MKEQERYLRKIQEYDFACIEANLFLDTHPDDKEALDYFKKVNKLRLEAYDVYSKMFGPLFADGVVSDEKWTWIDNPWPWERGAN